MTMANNIVELWILFPDGYKHALSIPIDECQKKSRYPLKWHRFIGFAIYGQAGHISDAENGTEVDYLSPTAFIFIQKAIEPSLLDPDGMDGRSVRSSCDSVSTARSHFRAELMNRDQTCVITGASDEYSKASHLIPHAKGAQYIEDFANYRGKDPSFKDINDPRNGLFLHCSLDRALGKSKLAFLYTPNFALAIDDIPSIEPLLSIPPLPPNRLTVHYFNLDDPLVLAFRFENSDVRLPLNTSDWPPPFVFDFVYGCAVLKAWDNREFLEWLRGGTRPIYYGDGDDGSGGEQRHKRQKTKHDRKLPAAAIHPKKGRKQAAERPRRASRKRAKSPDVMDMVMGLWKRHSPPKRRTSKQKTPETDAKIDAWRKAVE